jgi:DNA-binding response OmpR family regulator
METARTDTDITGPQRDYENVRFAIVEFRGDESLSPTEIADITGRQQLFVVPMRWRDLIAQAEAEYRYPMSAQVSDCVTFGEVSIDFSSQEAQRDNCPVILTSMEFKTLKFFICNPHRVITRDELLNKVWGYDNYPTTRTVDNRILRLRQKLERDAANPKHFRTVYGAGYKFVP